MAYQYAPMYSPYPTSPYPAAGYGAAGGAYGQFLPAPSPVSQYPGPSPAFSPAYPGYPGGGPSVSSPSWQTAALAQPMAYSSNFPSPGDAYMRMGPPQSKTPVSSRPIEKMESLSDASAAPDDFANAVGRQAGRLVTRVLEQNPELQDRLQTLGLDRLLADPERAAGEIRQNVQRSWMTRQLLQRFGVPLVRILPEQLEPAGFEALRWLQQPPGAHTL
ncbi:MAG: hypothetical protein IPK79_09750 [Vampirovibrionales bacterium]|nr:hypothetical protein [Vampirovibrionales bacterium]